MKFSERTTQRESTGALQGVRHGAQTGKQRGGKEEEDRGGRVNQIKALLAVDRRKDCEISKAAGFDNVHGCRSYRQTSEGRNKDLKRHVLLLH